MSNEENKYFFAGSIFNFNKDIFAVLNDQQQSSSVMMSSVTVEEVKISTSHAPWMRIAIREGQQWIKTHETEITDDYFRLVGAPKAVNSMVSYAWCSAFVNYCLQETDYTKSSGANGYNLVRANGIRKDDGNNFKQITKPVYGAIACNMYKENKQTNEFIKMANAQHVGFVLGVLNDTEFFRLGGNQGDHITIDICKIDRHEFYLPTKYTEPQEIVKRTEEQMKQLGITWRGRDHSGGTR